MEIKIFTTESFTTFVIRGPITIKTEDYPELEGMSEEDAKEYIRLNADDLSPSDGSDVYYSLSDELQQSDILRDKITNDESEIIFDVE
jgi:hypothetical protein